jgi:hypothetical protein
MKTQDTLIVHPSNAHEMNVIKAFFEALKIKFEVTKDSQYNPEFVSMIKQGQQDINDGKGITMTLDELEKLCK